MERTQIFRVDTMITPIKVKQVNEKNIVLWGDIEKVFPGVQSIKNDDIVVHFLKDSNGRRYLPKCIRHYPGEVLEVVFSAPINGVQADTHTTMSSLTFEKDLPQGSATTLSKLVSNLAATPEPPTGSEFPKPWYTTLTAEELNRRPSMRKSKYRIPHLFIVLPEEPPKHDYTQWHRSKFLFHAICEGGNHTKIAGSKIHHHLHLVKHEGFFVKDLSEFLKHYGPFLLLMLEWIKFGGTIAGHTLHPLASLKAIELGDSVQHSVKTVASMIDFMTNCINWQLRISLMALPDDLSDPNYFYEKQDLINYLNNVGGDFSASLAKLNSHLQTRRTAEPLHKATTPNGHPMRVCKAHWRAIHRQLVANKLGDNIERSEGTAIETSLYKAILAKASLAKASPAATTLDLWSKASQEREVQALSEVLGTNSSLASSVFLDKNMIKEQALTEVLSANRTRTTLSVWSTTIEGEGAQILSETLNSNRLMTTLNLCRNMVNQEGAQILFKALSTNSTLTNLNLWSNSITDDEIEILSEALKDNTALRTLDLGNNSLTKRGAASLSEALRVNTSVTTLVISNNRIGFEGGEKLAEALKTNAILTTLDMSYSCIGDVGALALSEALKVNVSLATLILKSNSIAEFGAEALGTALATNTTLTTLNLSDNLINLNRKHAMFQALVVNSTLTSLNLQSNSIGDKGAVALSEALMGRTALTHLDLTSNCIGDKGAIELSEALKINSTLIILNLSCNEIGDKGAVYLSRALSLNSILTTLYLESNRIGDSGALALSMALSLNSTLTALNLEYNAFREDGIVALTEAYYSR